MTSQLKVKGGRLLLAILTANEAANTAWIPRTSRGTSLPPTSRGLSAGSRDERLQTESRSFIGDGYSSASSPSSAGLVSRSDIPPKSTASVFTENPYKALFDAVIENDLPKFVRELLALKKEQQLSTALQYHRSVDVLHLAAEKSSGPIVSVLLNAAVKEQDIGLAVYLNKSINNQNPYFTPLLYAIRGFWSAPQPNIAVIEQLITAGAQLPDTVILGNNGDVYQGIIKPLLTYFKNGKNLSSQEIATWNRIKSTMITKLVEAKTKALKPASTKLNGVDEYKNLHAKYPPLLQLHRNRWWGSQVTTRAKTAISLMDDYDKQMTRRNVL